MSTRRKKEMGSQKNRRIRWRKRLPQTGRKKEKRYTQTSLLTSNGERKKAPGKEKEEMADG